MTRKPIFTLLLGLLASAALVAQQSSTQGKAGQAMGARYEDLQWQTIVPELGADSPLISILRVDPVTQATHLLIRVPKQIHVPMHWHSANETHTVIRGNWTFEHEGRRDQLGPGGFNYIPAKMHHQAWASDEALVFITVDSAWDVNWVSGPPTKANLGKKPDAP
jgi:mannose-6-phosphate isomerase-like protein (cupin superfamily)